MQEHPDLYFRRLSLGPMANFLYLIGSRRTRECVVVDPAWDTQALLDAASADDMRIVGSLVTHYHPDHVGGEVPGFSVPGGVAELLAEADAPAHVNKHEAEGLKFVTGLSDNDMVLRDSGDTLKIGDVEIRFVHTPGHTPGSQCFLVNERLVSGDTLFIGSCGRVDLPGADVDQMYESLTQKLSKIDDNVVLFPGHDYGATQTSTMREQRLTNPMLRVPNIETWRRLHGGQRG